MTYQRMRAPFALAGPNTSWLCLIVVVLFARRCVRSLLALLDRCRGHRIVKCQIPFAMLANLV